MNFSHDVNGNSESNEGALFEQISAASKVKALPAWTNPDGTDGLDNLNAEELRAMVRDLRREVLDVSAQSSSTAVNLVDSKEREKIDGLTGLDNRNSFDDAIANAIRRREVAGENLYFMMIDIDHFKEVNDVFGHDAGNLVLKDIADVFRSVLKRPNDKIFRIGGEEFGVLLDSDSYADVVHVGDMIREAVEKYGFHLPDGRVINKSVSVGFASLRDLPSNLKRDPLVKSRDVSKEVDGLYKFADRALYASKNTGRNRVIGFGDERFKAFEEPHDNKVES